MKYHDIWPSSGRPVPCENCGRNEADVFFSVRGAPSGLKSSHYVCAKCFYTGILDVLEEYEPKVAILDIHLDLSTPDEPTERIRSEQAKREREWNN